MSMDYKLNSRIEKLASRLGGTGKLVEKIARDVEQGAKVKIQNEAKSGRQYGAHTASAPGQAPATDTGNLVNSIHAERESEDTWIVSASAEYAQNLELGTRNMAPRPFLVPALQAVEADVLKALKAIFDE